MYIILTLKDSGDLINVNMSMAFTFQASGNGYTDIDFGNDFVVRVAESTSTIRSMIKAAQRN